MGPQLRAVRWNRLLPSAAVWLGLVSTLPTQAADPIAASALAVQLGCFNCHGAPRGDAPSMEALAEHFAKYQGLSEAALRRGERLRQVNRAHRIIAHEQLSSETAAQLVLWLADGAK